ncbi:MAG TPA: nuclear transport factor 2 family protein [Tepidiformaceae bacterium]|nr:nuclear transport factor 2 family protein [Tepidiformaceae bacterium]
MNLHAFIQEYTDAVYHGRDAEAAARYIADPCIRHEHGHRVVMSLAENQAPIRDFLAAASDVRFENATAVAEGELYARAYQFSFEIDGKQVTRSGIEIFLIREGKITETWNSAAGEVPWG